MNKERTFYCNSEHLKRAIVDECDKSRDFKVRASGPIVNIDIDMGDKMDLFYGIDVRMFSEIKNEIESIKLKKLAEAGKVVKN